MPETPPVRRGPGRPRKVQETETTNPDPKPEIKPDPDDLHIGEKVADDRWHHIAFGDGSEYRVEDGVIVERVR